MPKRHSSSRSAFTLIEVMVSVMIVSVVIAALIQMQSNTNLKFMELKKIIKANQYNSFLTSLSDKYGYESSNIDLYNLTDNFDLESDLRRRLKAVNVKIDYDVIKVIDSSDFTDSNDSEEDDSQTQSSGSGIIFEIGKTSLKSKDFSLSLMRVRVQ